MNEEMIFINTEDYQPPKPASNLKEGRSHVTEAQRQICRADVTVMISAYNRIEKTKRCIESILKYTRDIDYELILLDNGSSDGTLEYFQSIAHDKKTVIRTTKNQGAGFAANYISIMQLGSYLAALPNDVIVTENWLKNLLACADSDPSIGMVCPASSNVSNLQGIQMEFDNYDEMQRKAAANNLSDPKRWEERLRLVTTASLIKKEAIMAIGFPIFDSGFFHDFGDDDLSFRLRRAGYKIILAKDVWVHHDHTFGADSGRDPVTFQESLEIGRRNFRDKYYGIDAWDDVNNYMMRKADYVIPPKRTGECHILGVETRCGTPILDIKNKLRSYGCFQARSSAFTLDTRYEMDLKTICDGSVACDREEFMQDYFPRESFDYIVLDKPVNCFHEPQKLINDLLALAKHGAQLFLPLQNTYSFYEYMNILGQREVYSPTFAYNISLDLFHRVLCKSCKVTHIETKRLPLSDENEEILKSILKGCVPEASFNECFSRLISERFDLVVEKL